MLTTIRVRPTDEQEKKANKRPSETEFGPFDRADHNQSPAAEVLVLSKNGSTRDQEQATQPAAKKSRATRTTINTADRDVYAVVDFIDLTEDDQDYDTFVTAANRTAAFPNVIAIDEQLTLPVSSRAEIVPRHATDLVPSENEQPLNAVAGVQTTLAAQGGQMEGDRPVLFDARNYNTVPTVLAERKATATENVPAPPPAQVNPSETTTRTVNHDEMQNIQQLDAGMQAEVDLLNVPTRPASQLNALNGNVTQFVGAQRQGYVVHQPAVATYLAPMVPQFMGISPYLPTGHAPMGYRQPLNATVTTAQDAAMRAAAQLNDRNAPQVVDAQRQDYVMHQPAVATYLGPMVPQFTGNPTYLPTGQAYHAPMGYPQRLNATVTTAQDTAMRAAAQLNDRNAPQTAAAQRQDYVMQQPAVAPYWGTMALQFTGQHNQPYLPIGQAYHGQMMQRQPITATVTAAQDAALPAAPVNTTKPVLAHANPPKAANTQADEFDDFFMRYEAYVSKANPDSHYLSNNAPKNDYDAIFSQLLDNLQTTPADKTAKNTTVALQSTSTDVRESINNYDRMLQIEEALGHAPNHEEFECAICFVTIEIGDGVILRNCLHSFCKDCLNGLIVNEDSEDVKCPFISDDYACGELLQDREIRSLLSSAQYEKYLQKTLRIAECREQNAFHCQTPNCEGWIIVDPGITVFTCLICDELNCLDCKAVHTKLTCKQYKAQVKDTAKTQKALEVMIKKGVGMHCPGCKVFITKPTGCDAVICTMCRIEICWATKMMRRGPMGCNCLVNGQLCHPKCRGCH